MGYSNRKGQQLTLALKEIQHKLPQLTALDDLDGLFLNPLYRIRTDRTCLTLCVAP